MPSFVTDRAEGSATVAQLVDSSRRATAYSAIARRQQPTKLLRQPGGFEGFRVSQKVADANDLPRSNVKDFSKLLTELDAGHPGGQVHVTEREDRLAEVAELLGPIGEAFPRLAAVLPPNLSRAVMTSVGGGLSLKARLDRRVPLDVGIELGQKGVQIIGIPRLDGALDGLHVLLRHRAQYRAGSGGPSSYQGYAAVTSALLPRWRAYISSDPSE